ncbi:hypothetical protein LMH73_015600 [Vibrio splendidus]|nr:hypothetical protein [Vibrio splendidus]MCC4882910.1 hypothetical protein [Vibrio splendidus]
MNTQYRPEIGTSLLATIPFHLHGDTNPFLITVAEYSGEGNAEKLHYSRNGENGYWTLGEVIFFPNAPVDTDYYYYVESEEDGNYEHEVWRKGAGIFFDPMVALEFAEQQERQTSFTYNVLVRRFESK